MGEKVKSERGIIMETVMTAKEMAQRCKMLATAYKTLYVMGCFGAPMTEKNRNRYADNHAYNRRKERTAKIHAATEDTFGFDCVCMIKGLLWGWCGDSGKTYGGAKYKANGVPDSGADAMFRKCLEQTEDFSCVEIGEAVWLEGHIGIYIGDGLAVECTPNWSDGVQITACNCKKEGYATRQWQKHGKLPYLSYDGYSLARLRREVALVTQAPLPVLSEQENRIHILVCLAQKRLNTLGYGAGEADGVFGPVTGGAVRAYQQDKGCPVTGKLDEKTWSSLLEQEGSHE